MTRSRSACRRWDEWYSQHAVGQAGRIDDGAQLDCVLGAAILGYASADRAITAQQGTIDWQTPLQLHKS